MNILILGTGEIEQTLIKLCQKSRLLDKIYTASSDPLDDIPNIEYKDFAELSSKAKALHIDLTLIADKFFIQEGIVEFFKTKLLNIISVNKKWFNLELSRVVAKQLMNHYSINFPEIIKAPLSFPVVIRTNTQSSTKIAYSMAELIKIKQDLAGEAVFLEEYLNGKIYYLNSVWDGKNFFHFPIDVELTEVQQDRLDLYKTKLNFMFSDERADFIGMFTSKLIWAKNDWYVLDYIMHVDNKFNLENYNADFLYLLNSAIYQKLDEIS